MPTFSNVRDKLFRKSSNRSEKQPTLSRDIDHTNPYTSGNPTLLVSTYDDAPPEYTPSPTITQQHAAPRSVPREMSDNDRYANLGNFDTILLIDDSGSMAGSLWKEAEAALKSIAEIITKYDDDGIDIYFLNHKSKNESGKSHKLNGGYYHVTSKRKVEQIFSSVRPRGATPTGMRLEDILRPYRKQLRTANDVSDVKPINLIVITDGEPTDNPRQAIVPAARELEQLYAPSYQIGIQFFQIGSSKDATRALRELDDGLKEEGIRDIVDTTPCQWADERAGRVSALTGDAILKTVLGAVDKRIDSMEIGRRR